MKFLKSLDPTSITDENDLYQLSIGYPGVLYVLDNGDSSIFYFTKKQYFFLFLQEKTNSFAKESYIIQGTVNGNPVTFTGVRRESGEIVYYARIPVVDSNVLTLNSFSLTDSGEAKTLYVGNSYYYSGGGTGGSLTPNDASINNLLKDSGYAIAQIREIVKDSSNTMFNEVVNLCKSKGIFFLGTKNSIFIGGGEPVKFINKYDAGMMSDFYYSLYGDVGFIKNDIMAGGVVTLSPDTES